MPGMTPQKSDRTSHAASLCEEEDFCSRCFVMQPPLSDEVKQALLEEMERARRWKSGTVSAEPYELED